MKIKSGKHILFFLLSLLSVQGEILGQQKDFQTWWEFSLDKGIGKGIDLSGEIEQRFRNNSLQYDRTQVTVAGEYGLNKYLDIAAGFRAFLASNNELQLNTKYRLHVDGTGKFSLSGFDMSLRARLQYGFEDIFDPAFAGGNNLGNRYRLKVAQHIFGTRLEWFALVESWHLLNDEPERLFYKIRYSAGIQYDLNFQSQLGLRYILEDEFNVVRPVQSHILVFGFSHKL